MGKDIMTEFKIAKTVESASLASVVGEVDEEEVMKTPSVKSHRRGEDMSRLFNHQVAPDDNEVYKSIVRDITDIGVRITDNQVVGILNTYKANGCIYSHVVFKLGSREISCQITLMDRSKVNLLIRGVE